MASFLGLAFLGAVCVCAAGMLVYRLVPDAERLGLFRRLRPWAIKGLAAPAVIWAVMNLGVTASLQPFMPQVQAAQNSGSGWAGEFFRVLGSGLFIISSYWGAMTLGWFLVEAGAGAPADRRKPLRDLCRACLLVMLLPAALLLLLGGWPAFGLAAAVILAPMTHYVPDILRAKPAPPIYARAIARMKFGKYTEAEQEIIRELEKCEDDFDGWMMLADLYATRFNDLAEAEQVIIEIGDHPKTTAPQLAMALHRLADWYLKQADDPDAARRALQVICDRLKGTHLARMAQLRINQLPATREELREQRSSRSIPLPALGDTLDAAPPPPESDLDRRKAAAAANTCVAKLKQDPNDAAAREKFARLLAEHLDQAGQAIEQVTLLLELPDQPEAKRAEWLGLIAAWHLRYRQNTGSARPVLERIIREFPQSPQAVMARRRLQLMDRERRT